MSRRGTRTARGLPRKPGRGCEGATSCSPDAKWIRSLGGGKIVVALEADGESQALGRSNLGAPQADDLAVPAVAVQSRRPGSEQPLAYLDRKDNFSCAAELARDVRRKADG